MATGNLSLDGVDGIVNVAWLGQHQLQLMIAFVQWHVCGHHWLRSILANCCLNSAVEQASDWLGRTLLGRRQVGY